MNYSNLRIILESDLCFDMSTDAQMFYVRCFFSANTNCSKAVTNSRAIANSLGVDINEVREELRKKELVYWGDNTLFITDVDELVANLCERVEHYEGSPFG